MGILGKPGSCTLDVSLWKEYLAPYVLLAFIRHVSHEAGSLFIEVFDALRDCLILPRTSKYFRERVSTLAYCLGLIYGSIRIFDLSEDVWCHRVSKMFVVRGPRADYSQFPTFHCLFSETEIALSQLNHLGTGLDSDRFQDGCGVVLPLCNGLYLNSSNVSETQAGQTPALYT